MELKMVQADKPKAMAWLASAIDSLSPKKKYKLTISENTKRRSLSANAYAWVLIDKLAEEYNLPPEYIYRYNIREIGGNGLIVSVDTEMVHRTTEVWESRGLGWIVEPIGECGNITELRLIYGSSAYDTRQMASLINSVVQECKAAGIETMHRSELDSLLRAWGERGA